LAQDNEEDLVSLDIEVVDIGELEESEYEIQLALDPSTPWSASVSPASRGTITLLCSTRGTTSTWVRANLYNPYRNPSNPSQNRLYQLTDYTNATNPTLSTNCASMLNGRGERVYVAANSIYVEGSAGAYFTIRSTWWNAN